MSLELISQRDGERTWVLRAGQKKRIRKGVRVRDFSPDDVWLTSVDGCASWRRFYLDKDRDGIWLIAERDWVDGTTWEVHEPSPDDLVRLAQIVAGLHEHGMFHGDLQPNNVIQTESGLVLIDTRIGATIGPKVAGSAPLMAPEQWEGASPGPSADVYALATLIYRAFDGDWPYQAADLSSWARAHLSKKPRKSQKVPKALRDLLFRVFQSAPDERPQIESIIEQLRLLGAKSSVAPVGLPWPSSFDAFLDTIRSADSLELVSDADTASLVLDRACRQLELEGQTVLQVRASDGPFWEPLIRSIEELSGKPVGPLTGDRLRVFRRFAEVLSPRQLVVFSDPADAYSQDLKDWASWYKKYTNGRVVGHRGLLEAAEVLQVRISENDFWKSWRARSTRAEIRDIPRKRFEELTRAHGESLCGMLRALNAEIGAGSGVTKTALDTTQLKALTREWEETSEAMIQACAFSELSKTASQIYKALKARRRAKAEREKVLKSWTDALVFGSRSAPEIEELAAALRDEKLFVELARLFHALGRHADGLDVLDGVDGFDAGLWRAQLSLSAGRFDDAERYALETSKAWPDASGWLSVLKAAPRAMRGEHDSLKELEDCVRLPDIAPLYRARLHAYRGIGLTRAGRLDEACDAYVRALEIVEAEGLDGELPTYLLNAGTAYHRQGRLGLAREFYARGNRISHDSTRPNTRALLLANQGNIDLTLGRFEEADELVRRAAAIAEASRLGTTEVMCLTLMGDLAARRGEPDGAKARYREALSKTPSPSQRVEILLATAKLELDANSLAAEKLVEEARTAIEEGGVLEHGPLFGIVRARLGWAIETDTSLMSGIELFRRSLKEAHSAGHHKLVLEESPHLMRVLISQGLEELEEEVLDLVKDSRNAIAMGLTRELRRDFFASLPGVEGRDEPVRAPEKSVQPSQTPESAEAFFRLLGFNEVILRATSLDEMANEALDIALSLSGAERAFLLLREGKNFKVAARRNMDLEGAEDQGVSQTIAEEAARTGRTVSTVNAKEDARFQAARSVVDLDLTSVLCVPVRNADGLLGALYLDHRYTPGAFSGQIPRLMEAYGHQFALALTNLERISKLEHSRAELAEANERLDAIARERELAIESLRDEVVRVRASKVPQVQGLVWVSRVMEEVLIKVKKVGASEIPVVVCGESGTGKELLARAIHDASGRARGPFVALNCGALTETLMESEMFGHVKGAFTGAVQDRIGMFQAADKGTLFLDEIAELPLAMQVKLLRVLQEGVVRRVGSTRSEKVDVRIVAATHKNLEKMIQNGDFREDLYYRIAAISLAVPALRERTEDIVPIANAILKSKKKSASLSVGAAELVLRHDWPGNVRELQNVMSAGLAMAESDRIEAHDLQPFIRSRVSGAPTIQSRRPEMATEPRSQGRPRAVSVQEVKRALEAHDGHRELAARELGISVRTLYRVLNRAADT